MRPTYMALRKLLDLMDWSGHVELPSNDLDWLAEQLSQRLINPHMQVCESCDTPRDVVVPSPLGSICESCLSELAKQADEIRDQLEDDG